MPERDATASADRAFLLRRLIEEEDAADRSSCLVRAVHEEAAEMYAERLKLGEIEAALNAAGISAAGT